jgi:hypothetical protein
MTLQASGIISLSDVQGEFGGSAPTSISEYYRGGTYVPVVDGSFSIPTSGTISLSDFYGADGDPDVVFQYPYARYNGPQFTDGNVGASYVRNGPSVYEMGSGYSGTPFTMPSSMGVLSITSVNQNMPFFVGHWAATLENIRCDLPYQTTGMRDIGYGYQENWIETNVLGLDVTYLDEDWTSNYYNTVNAQSLLEVEFVIFPGYDYP